MTSISKISCSLIATDSKGNDILFTIQENHQNSLKGLIWGVASAALAPCALGFTAYTAAAVVTGSLIGVMNTSSGPIIMPLVGATLVLDYLAVKCTGACVRNALHHFGPKYQIVKA